MKFSERYGHVRVRSALQVNGIDDGLRNRLWNLSVLVSLRELPGGKGSEGWRSDMKPEPQPCTRFKHMNITSAFLKHLPQCSACRSVIAHLHRESEVRLDAQASKLILPAFTLRQNSRRLANKQGDHRS
jgi:hypothetical protein